jgi:hypothetical protein
MTFAIANIKRGLEHAGADVGHRPDMPARSRRCIRAPEHLAGQEGIMKKEEVQRPLRPE